MVESTRVQEARRYAPQVRALGKEILTQLTRQLAMVRPSVALERAGRVVPDWSGGTRIADALGEFNRTYGRRGMARGAVVLIISDGWETGDPADLGEQMALLASVAYRVVWANPRLVRTYHHGRSRMARPPGYARQRWGRA
jgi:uncharacterized protein with von Willebrand factor type A (vWA) domain